MLKYVPLLAIALYAGSAEAQIVVTGGRGAITVSGTGKSRVPDPSVSPTSQIRCPRRERNPYFVARPVYPAAERGARANITFEPYTSRYYPTENSYYPPLNPAQMTRSR